MVRDHNSNVDATYKMAINKFADRLPSEKRSVIPTKDVEFKKLNSIKL